MMSKFKFGACEYNFPMWGSLALEMAHDAGFDGIEITDGGGYLQPHPMNKGLFVEYERLALNLVRLDGFPLTDKIVQEDYLEAQEKTGIAITGIHLYFLNNQGFVNCDNDTLQGQDALKTIKNAIIAASQMNIPLVTIPTKGMFGTAKLDYALQKLTYAVAVGEEYGIRVANSFDTDLARELAVIDGLQGKLRVDFNTLDPAIYGREPAPDMIRALGRERIEQIKIKDLKADREGFLTKETGGDALIGCGDTDWAACVAAAKEIGYEGWVISDTPFNSLSLNRNGEDYESLAAKDLNTLKKAFEA
jgi:sugar phosphate isomerase/epimerase